MPDKDRKNPGDEDAPGTPQTGDAICPECQGTGTIKNRTCPTCNGSGKITAIIGDA
jgi:DnaJ-class molecular chaperone